MTSGYRSSLPASVAWTPWTTRRPDLWPSRISAPSRELPGKASGACAVLSAGVTGLVARGDGHTTSEKEIGNVRKAVGEIQNVEC